MAQAYFITRGKDNVVNEWIKHLAAKWWPYDYNGQKGVIENMVRPIQFWEMGFPAEHRDIAMNTLFDGQIDQGRHQADWKGRAGLKVLAKALGAKPIAPFDINKGKLPMPSRAGMSVMGIGERADKINYHPLTGKPNEGI